MKKHIMWTLMSTSVRYQWWLLKTVVEVGLIIPPVGMNFFVINAMDRKTSMVETYRAVLYFVASDLMRVAILIAFPITMLLLVPL